MTLVFSALGRMETAWLGGPLSTSFFWVPGYLSISLKLLSLNQPGVDLLATNFVCKVETLAFMYLGFPMGRKHDATEVCKTFEDKRRRVSPSKGGIQ